MYLKGIEVSGFKSFARKTEFQFQDGITGIVGPNGSGKSNIADAMRWVLGEQSARQLRSSNMQDVIFAGTENRRPQGYAYVNIVFDNSDHTLPVDYDEVTIGRRVYRSGESEYLINSNSCRLKDVQELFYDTGVGKEGYSIIGQGQIDKILSGKPEDRRELFDEAAGIVKFKKRKAAALNRLAKEEESLVRINDILSELTRQEGPLKNQAEKARNYIRLHDELRIDDVNDYLLEVEESKSILQELTDKLSISGSQLEETRQKAAAVKTRYGALGDSIARLRHELETLRQRQKQDREEIGRKRAEEAVLKEQISADQAQKQLYQEQAAQIAVEIKAESAEREELQEELEDLEQALRIKNQRYERLQSQISEFTRMVEESEQHIREQQEMEISLTGEQSRLLVDRQRFDTMSEQTELRAAELNGKLLQARSQEAEARAQLRQGKAAMKEVQQSIADCKAQIEQARETLRTTGLELEQSRREEDQTRSALHQARARFDSVQNLAERYEGYGMSIRRLMEAKKQFPGIHGVLADLIHVEKRYEIAIETALGGALQNIVTDHEQTAKQCIEYLKRNRMGRATFLPVTTVKPRGGFQEQSALQMKGVCGTADELVHTDGQYQGIIRFLLGRILVVDTMDHALAAASRYHYSFRIVTLEGESLNAGGSISGGAYKNNSNLLGRRRELEELELAVQKAKAACERAETQVEVLAARQEQEVRALNQLNQTMQDKQLEFSRVEMTLRQNLDLLDAARDEKANLEQDVAALLEEKAKLVEKYEKTARSASELEESIRRSHDEAEAMEVKALAYRSQMNRLLEQRITDQIEQTTLQEKKHHTQTDLERVSGQLEQKQAVLTQYKTRQQELQDSMEEKQARLTEGRQLLQTLEHQILEQDGEIELKNARSEKFAAEQQTLFQQQESCAQEVSVLEKEVFRLEHRKETLEDNLERRAAYLWEEYELTPSQAVDYRVEELSDRSILKTSIQHLKNEIRALGSINTNAVEEYAALSERLDFMRSQHEDLVHARENLQLLIGQLDEGMKNQFSDKFKDIQKEFDKVFKELFGGGTGTLELSEAEDMLEAGILIHVQPPGKKLQNMMQLSGGEKALTAISLLFAIQNLKPSPFCILDEIEAALDDANVDRFAEYLNKLKKNTQFIVITHRRGTMLIADQLYGITMQEKGISSLVSVDLTDEV